MGGQMQGHDVMAASMQHHDALNLGMFVGGALMALVAVTISMGIVIWIYRQKNEAPKD